MKKIVSCLVIIILSQGIYSCGGEKKEPQQKNVPATTGETYQCPMKCENKLYNNSGKCSTCEMDLEKVSEI